MMTPDHVVAFGSAWQLWRCVCLRSAGFSVDNLLSVASQAAVDDAHQVLVREDEIRQATEALCVVTAAELEQSRGSMHRKLSKRLQRLRRGQCPEHWPAGARSEPSFAALQAPHAQRVEQLDAMQQSLATARVAHGGVLRAVAASPRFREAIQWQNPRAVETALEALGRRAPGTGGSKTRQHEQLVAMYMQRYCAKNDTIGFFGPVGWGQITEEPNTLRAEPGNDPLATRQVYFEHWAIDTLAQRLSDDPRVLEDIPPRRNPLVLVRAGEVVAPGGEAIALPPDLEALLRVCNGSDSPRDIASAFADRGHPSLGELEAVIEGIEALAESELVFWALEIPPAGEHPQRHLARLLCRVTNPRLRADGRAKLQRLEDERRRMEAAAGHPERLKQANEGLESAFAEVTQARATRRKGEAYAGRTLVYEDCRRGGRFQLGQSFLDALRPPLELVLASTRWFTHEAARRFQAQWSRSFDALVARHEPGPVPFSSFFEEIGETLYPREGGPAPAVAAAQRELRAKWREVLGPFDDGARAVQRSASSIRSAALESFEAPHGGWPMARYQSPDLLIAAADVDAIDRGEFDVVLGEVHVGSNTIGAQLFVKEHPDPRGVCTWLGLDAEGVQVHWITTTKNVSRADYFSIAPGQVDLEIGDARSARPRSEVRSIGEFFVSRSGAGLVVTSPSRGETYPLAVFMEHHLIATTMGCFSLVEPEPHTPRISIDRLVISRERWSLDPSDLGFVHDKDTSLRFLGTQRLARAHGLPRFMFYKIPEEPKPCYLDLHSPIFVDLFTRQMRRASRVSLTEMLPRADQAWLPNADGSTSVCELRVVALDSRRYPR